MAIVFLSRLNPESLEDSIIKANKRGMPEAAISLQNKILKGINHITDEKISIVNVAPISSYPQNSSLKKIPTLVESYKKIGMLHNVGFVNYTWIRNYSIIHNLMRCLAEIEEMDKVIVYSTTPFFLETIKKIKRSHPNGKITLVIPDVPEYGNLKDRLSIKERIYKYLAKRTFEKAKDSIDSLVLLTKQTAGYLNWTKPYSVVEGIADSSNLVSKVNNTTVKTIVYTGTTHIKFGLPLLVEAFEKIPNKDVELIICGYGDYDEQLRILVQKDPRIKFLGKVSHEEAIRIQMNATVLVNPRMNDGEYTKYSFPSKTMEYLTTGNPVIACKLHGIPDEYDPYIIYVDDESVDGLEQKLIEVLSWTTEDRQAFGKKARDFVINTKNETSQAQKILDLLHI